MENMEASKVTGVPAVSRFPNQTLGGDAKLLNVGYHQYGGFHGPYPNSWMVFLVENMKING